MFTFQVQMVDIQSLVKELKKRKRFYVITKHIFLLLYLLYFSRQFGLHFSVIHKTGVLLNKLILLQHTNLPITTFLSFRKNMALVMLKYVSIMCLVLVTNLVNQKFFFLHYFLEIHQNRGKPFISYIFNRGKPFILYISILL